MDAVTASILILRRAITGRRGAVAQHLDVVTEEVERLRAIEQRARGLVEGDDAHLAQRCRYVLGEASLSAEPSEFDRVRWAFAALASAYEVSDTRPARWELGKPLLDATARATGVASGPFGKLLGVPFVVSEGHDGYGWRLVDASGVVIVEGTARSPELIEPAAYGEAS